MTIQPRSFTAITTLLVVTINAAGCATIINGRNQDIAVASTPPAAIVKVDGLQTTTPGNVELQRNRDYTLVFTKNGFPEREVKLESGPSGWLLGNLVFGGLIGLIIDFVTGGAYKLSPGSVDMDMATGTAKKVEQ